MINTTRRIQTVRAGVWVRIRAKVSGLRGVYNLECLFPLYRPEVYTHVVIHYFV